MNREHQVMQVRILAPHEPGLRQEAQLAQEETPPIKEALELKTSLQIKAAEYWLKLGEADQALRELEALPSSMWNCGWALKTRIAAIGAWSKRNIATVQN